MVRVEDVDFMLFVMFFSRVGLPTQTRFLVTGGIWTLRFHLTIRTPKLYSRHPCFLLVAGLALSAEKIGAAVGGASSGLLFIQVFLYPKLVGRFGTVKVGDQISRLSLSVFLSIKDTTY